MPEVVHVLLLATCLKLQAIRSVRLPLPGGLGCAGTCQEARQGGFLRPWGPGTGQQVAQGTSLPPPASACLCLLAGWPALKGLWGELGGWGLGLWSGPLSHGHVSESVPGYSLTWAMGSLREAGPGLWEPGECISSPHAGEAQSGSQESGGQALCDSQTQRPGLHRCLLGRDGNAGWGERDSREGPAGFLRAG